MPVLVGSDQEWLRTCRLRPSERLIDSLKQFVANKQIQAGMISTCVGSLQEVQHAALRCKLTDYNTAAGALQVVIRFANQEVGKQLKPA